MQHHYIYVFAFDMRVFISFTFICEIAYAFAYYHIYILTSSPFLSLCARPKIAGLLLASHFHFYRATRQDFAIDYTTLLHNYFS